MEDPPYLICDIPRGACKQRGRTEGFYTCASRDDISARWQTALLPVVLAASFVFAGLSTFGGQNLPQNFLLNWSAILTAGASFALPLAYALPVSRLARRLQKTGCAIAGYDGAEHISRRRCVVLTDTDLFPPGTITLNGMPAGHIELRAKNDRRNLASGFYQFQHVPRLIFFERIQHPLVENPAG